MASRLGRSIVAATVLALAVPAVVGTSAGAVEPPSLPQLDPSAQAPTSGERFHPDPSAVSIAPRSTRDATQVAAVPGTVSATATIVTSTEARVQWNIPSNGGSPLTGYHVRLLQNGTVIDEAILGTETAVWISDLTPDTEYAFQVAAVNAEGTAEFSVPIAISTSHYWLERLAGADRFETAVAVSQQAFPFEGVQTAFIANGLNFPDALAAAAAGGTFGGPVLLTRPTSVDAGTAEEVALLKPQYVIAAGGRSAVSDGVLNQLRPYAQIDALRADGISRYDTAGWIAQMWGEPPVPVVYLASGTSFPDALAGAAAAGFNGAPVLLTRQDSLPEETAFYLDQLKPSKIVVLGGPGAVSQTALNQARAAAGGAGVTTERMSGASRYDTAVDISRRTFTSPRVPVVYIASGLSFADALAGAAAAGSIGGPVLLTDPSSITDATLAEITRLDPVRVVVLGGASAVSLDIYNKIQTALQTR